MLRSVRAILIFPALLFLVSCHNNSDSKLGQQFVGNWSAIQNHTLYLLTIKDNDTAYHWEHWSITFGVYDPNELMPKYWPTAGGMTTDATFHDSAFYSTRLPNAAPIKIINDSTLLYMDGVTLYRNKIIDSLPWNGKPTKPETDSSFIGYWRPDYSWYEGPLHNKITRDPMLVVSRYADHYFIQFIDKKARKAVPWHAVRYNNFLTEPEGHHRMVYLDGQRLVLEGPAYYPTDETRILMTFLPLVKN